MFLRNIHFLSAILLSAGSVGDVSGAPEAAPAPAGDMPEAAPAPGESNAMEAAPGCETPEGATPQGRVPFPALASVGGVFRSEPGADGTVHFDISLLPEVPEWPLSQDAEGKSIPLPWTGHNRTQYLALTRDCFSSNAGYYFYRMHEAHGKFMSARQEFIDARDGVAKEQQNKAKKTANLLNELTSLSAELGGTTDLAAIMAELQKRMAATAAPAPTPAA
jgi:hypothetical protein